VPELAAALASALPFVPGSYVAKGAKAGAKVVKETKAAKAVSNASNVPKNIYTSIKAAPNYPSGFKAAQNGTKSINVNNKELLEQLRKVESGEWKKIYMDGYLDGKKVSIHYFKHIKTGKVYDVDVKYKWSNNTSK